MSCIENLRKPLLVSGDFKHCPMSKEKRMRKVEGHYSKTSAELEYHIFAGNGAHSSPQGLCYHLPVCVLQLAVCSLPRGVLIFLESPASPAAFERSQLGA